MIGKSALFVPASSPAMLNASRSFNADSLIFDWEDAVDASEKDAARELLIGALKHIPFAGKNLIVRINALTTEYWQDDLIAIDQMEIDTILVPKARPHEIEQLSAWLDERRRDIGLMAIIESALAVEEVKEIILASRRMVGILFGAEDYTADMGIERTKEGSEILYARAKLANAAHAYGIEALDTPFTSIDDLDGLREDTLVGKKLGYTGKAAISPKHVELINKIFLPAEEEIQYALRVMNSVAKAKREGKGAYTLDGKMIDLPIIIRAQKVLERAGLKEGEIR
ncbi:MAG: HpcH/HpaI aldolase/citrate lyase family protein [bacterium]|jgi:citrate lyase subunit beta/citryl-CoA lyase